MFRFIRTACEPLALRTAGAAAALLLSFAPAGQAQSDPGYDWSVVSAHVTYMELTYFPTTLPFGIDVNAGSCSSGTRLNYASNSSDATVRAANMKAVLAALMTAKASNTPIQVYGRNAGCTVTFIYLG
jgi:hypothetical protein